MDYLNKWIGIGRLGRDLEMSTARSGAVVCRGSIAINRTSPKSRESGTKEESMWLNFIGFGKTAEWMAKCGRRGELYMVEGKLWVEEYEKEGQKKTSVTVTVDKFSPLSPRQHGQDAAPPPPAGQQELLRPKDPEVDDAPF